jgi:hypothetical protein
MLSDHYAFAIEDLRRNGPRPAEIKWRAGRADVLERDAREQASFAGPTREAHTLLGSSLFGSRPAGTIVGARRCEALDRILLSGRVGARPVYTETPICQKLPDCWYGC